MNQVKPFVGRGVRSTGRLGQAVEGGGYSPLATMLIRGGFLRPVHNWLMEVWIYQDGTFDQTQSLVRLVGHSVCDSFDLKSATDRWPKG